MADLALPTIGDGGAGCKRWDVVGVIQVVPSTCILAVQAKGTVAAGCPVAGRYRSRRLHEFGDVSPHDDITSDDATPRACRRQMADGCRCWRQLLAAWGLPLLGGDLLRRHAEHR